MFNKLFAKFHVSFMIFLAFAVTFMYSSKMGKLLAMDSLFGDVADTIPYDEAVKSGIVSDRINIDYSEMIYKDRTSIAPMIYLIDSLKAKPALTTEVRGFEQRSAPHIVTVNGAVTTAASAGDTKDIILDAGFRKNLIVNQTLEIRQEVDAANGYTKYVYITAKSVSDVNKITVAPIDATKKIGKNASIGIPDDSEIWITGSMFGQYDSSVKAVTVLPTVISNVTQIIRTPIELSRSASKERMYGETERNRLLEIARFQHLLECEKTLLFNGPKVVVKQSSTESIHRGYMQGMEYTVLNNSDKVKQYDGSRPFVEEHDEWQNDLFDPQLIDGAQFKRFSIANRAYRKYWTDLKKDKPGIEIGPNGKYGIPGVDTVITDSGTFDLLIHPLWNARYANILEPASMALHMNFLEYRPYLKTMLKANIQNPDVDGVKDEFITEFTWMMYLPELHGIIRKLPS